MPLVTITRKYEFDAGHRIPSHGSKCRHLHGHRYVVEVSIQGEVLPDRGASDDGMVVDFGDLKTMIAEAVDPWDHAMLLYQNDPLLAMLNDTAEKGTAALVNLIVNLGIVEVSFIPTVENMAQNIHQVIQTILDDELKGARVYNVRLYETPNCWADTRQ